MSDLEPDHRRSHRRKNTPIPAFLRGAGGLVMRLFMLAFAVAWLSGVGAFFYFLVPEFVRSLRAGYAYQPITATVTAVTATTKDEFGEERTGSVTYAYVVDGKTCEGRASPENCARAAAKEQAAGATSPPDEPAPAEAIPARTPAPGDTLTVYYDPADPSANTLRPEADPMFIGFFIFLMPFVAVGVGLIVAIFSPAGKLSGMQAAPSGVLAGAWFGTYAVLSAVTAFAFFITAMMLPWQAALVLGLGLWWVGVPGLTVVIVRAIRARRMRREAEEHAAAARAAAHRAAGVSSRACASATNSPAAGGGGAGSTGRRRAAAGVGFLAFFTIFWCGITGVFVAVIGWQIYHQLDAQLRFLPTSGVVLASKVESHSGDDGSTYSARIQYRYNVDGHEYTGERFTFSSLSSSDSGHWREVVAAHPPGKAVTVYYDPADPSVAVLDTEVPGFLLFPVLFMQPFVLIGLALLGMWTWRIARRASVRRYLAEPGRPPCRVPMWGTLVEEGGALTVVLAPRVGGAVGSFAAGYGMTCFLLIFIVGFTMGFGGATRSAVLAAFAAAAAVGVVSAVVGVRKARGRAVVRIETDRGGELTVRSPKRDVHVPMADVAGWAVRRIPSPWQQQQGSATTPLLVAVTTAGHAIPVHVFGGPFTSFAGEDKDTALAAKVARDLADLTGKPFLEPPPGASADMGDGGRSPRGYRASNKKYGDLT